MAPATDPSMEDILASIRRILSEDEKAAGAPPSAAGGDNVLVLDETMLVPEASPPPPVHSMPAPPPPAPSSAARPAAKQMVEPDMTEQTQAQAMADDMDFDPPPIAARPTLVAPEAAAAALSSVDTLVRQLAQERSTQVHRGGPTIEDLVREEMRPLLKEWLDTNLPPLVERLVRSELDRLISRATA